MKIVHVSSADTAGGASRAAYRLHRALVSAGVDSTMLVNEKHSNDDTVSAVVGERDFADEVSDLVKRHYFEKQRTALWNTYFSLGWPGTDLSTHPLVVGADVIHLHWLWNFQSAVTLARLMNLGKPVVWSFHDLRAMTGGCHFPAGCRGYELACNDCPQLKTDPARITAAAHADQTMLWPSAAVTVIGPSRWMADCARKSAIWRDSRIEVIPYSLDTDVYRPQGKLACRRMLGLAEDGLYILFGADHGQEIRKGFSGLMRAVKRCLDDVWFSGQLRQGRIQFICFGYTDPNIVNGDVPIRALGHLKGDAEMVAAYSAADFFILPSLEDNLPNTVLESMSCGTPVLSFDVGGSKDMIIEGRTGWLVAPGEEVHMAEMILKISREPSILSEMTSQCREHVLTEFCQSVQARRFFELYDMLLDQPPVYGHQESTADATLPARLDCGQRTRFALPDVLKAVAARQRAGFRKPLEREIGRDQSFGCFLKGLELAWKEGKDRASLRKKIIRLKKRLFSWLKRS